MDKSIYIVLSQTGTVLSRVLKRITNDRYNHSSISLDKSLEPMYSFGRLNPYNPVVGGFVRESINCGTFKRFKNTEALVLEVSVTEEQYNKLSELLLYMYERRRHHHYNYLGLIIAALKINYMNDKDFYCSQFIRCILNKYAIEGSDKIPDIAKPAHFTMLENSHVFFEGKLQDYGSLFLEDKSMPDCKAESVISIT